MNLLICITTSDWIQIANIITTVVVGAWIAISVQSNLTKSRYLREYYIQEIKDIRDQYKCFLNEIYQGKKSAIHIRDWFKIMSLKINNLNEFIHQSYNIHNSIIKEKHSEIQKYITGTEDFNDNFRKDKVIFADSTKLEILKHNGELTKVLTQRVIDINSARKLNWFERRFNKS